MVIFVVHKMAVAYSDRRKHFMLEEMAEVLPKLNDTENDVESITGVSSRKAEF